MHEYKCTVYILHVYIHMYTYLQVSTWEHISSNIYFTTHNTKGHAHCDDYVQQITPDRWNSHLQFHHQQAPVVQRPIRKHKYKIKSYQAFFCFGCLLKINFSKKSKKQWDGKTPSSQLSGTNTNTHTHTLGLSHGNHARNLHSKPASQINFTKRLQHDKKTSMWSLLLHTQHTNGLYAACSVSSSSLLLSFFPNPNIARMFQISRGNIIDFWFGEWQISSLLISTYVYLCADSQRHFKANVLPKFL